MMKRNVIALLITAIASTALYAAPAEDVVCEKCVHGTDIAGGSISSGKIRQEAVTRAKIAPYAVGAKQIEARAVQRRVSGKCFPGSFITAVNKNGSVECDTVLFQHFSLSDGSGVASLSCPYDTNVVSVSCDCNNANGTRNFGVLFGCTVAGNGGVAGCFNEAGSFNPYLPNPLATAKLVCVTAVDGIATQSKTDDGVDEELAAALKAAQDRAMDHAAMLQTR